ncbi:hypothetical protein AB6D66_01445 [Vibrio pomeroyi]|uniref:Uncharacterized protein n=1 Tax=Vibrio pomeroyi TaxID=198832 RepID=A0ABV4MRG1_9VIBR|nr:hypothetical protein [Vibrio atlanticus]MCZ4310211.1 hypothetical protein [Vibrio atlanticus]
MRTNNFIWPSPMPGINPDIRETIYKPTLEFIQDLDGKHYADLSLHQKKAAEYLFAHGSKYGVYVLYEAIGDNSDICLDSGDEAQQKLENENCIVRIDLSMESETLLLNLRLDLSDSANFNEKPAAKTGFIAPMLALTFFVKITALPIYIFSGLGDGI